MEIADDVDDIMTKPESGSVLPSHFEKLLRLLEKKREAELDYKQQAGLAPATTRREPGLFISQRMLR
jgi:hypothetical protein